MNQQYNYFQQQHSNSSVTSDKTLKILVLGDSGVGKTSLLRSISYKGDLPNNNKYAERTTVGCNIEVYLHTDSKNNNELWDVELWDVAGIF